MLYRLPVSRQAVRLQPPDGRDDLFLAESSGSGWALRVEVVKRLAPPEDGSARWDLLPAPDVDAALLALRRWLRGDRLVAEIHCPQCRAKGDLTLSISEYLRAHAPSRSRGIECDDDSWFRLEGARFRVPTVAQLLESLSKNDGEEEAKRDLEEQCVLAESRPALRRARSFMERIAPLLCGEVEGECPECGSSVFAWLEPGEFVITEFRRHAGSIFEEVHLLANSYGWTEEVILGLSADRRSQYANMIVSCASRPVRASAWV
ncbi:MAG: hypothetical protein AABZ47_11695 [Planctomycetota bacterium]